MLLLFLAYLAGMELLLITTLVGSRPFVLHLEMNAWAAARLLSGLGFSAASSGRTIRLEERSLEVGYGCDGLQPILFFACAVLAFPADPWKKIIGFVAGIPAILAMNVVRVGTLLLSSVYFPRAFSSLHVQIWPIVILLGTIAMFACWARRAASQLR